MNISTPTSTVKASPVVPANGESSMPAMAIGQDESVSVVTRYLHIALRHRWVLISAIGVTVVLGLLVTLLQTPLYTATTQIEIARNVDKVVRTNDQNPSSRLEEVEFYQTQYGLLESRSLAERV